MAGIIAVGVLAFAIGIFVGILATCAVIFYLPIGPMGH